MNDKIKCPSCAHSFDVEEALAGQIQEQLQAQYEAKVAENTKHIQSEKAKLEEERKAFAAKKEKENEIFKAKLAEKVKLESERIEKEKLEDLNLQLNALHEENEKRKNENRQLKQQEIKLLKDQAALKEREEEMMLKLEKELLEKSAAIENKGRLKEREQFELKEREYKKQLDDQKKLMEEMQRKHAQGSMQLQGEVQELAIEEWLRSNFPLDTIDEIKKGARGADCLQKIRTHSNPECGSIYYESKRTKEFQKSWIEKFRNDLRAKGADIGVIVTDALPKGEERMCLREGIWICTYEEFKGLCFVLRENIVQISSALSSQENKGDKMVMLYKFLTSNEFKLQIEAIVEGFTQMQSDLESEKRSIQGHWKKREKQLQKVLLNTNHMYNSFKGIAGNAIMPIRELEFDDPTLLEEKAAQPSSVYDLDKEKKLSGNQLFE